MGGALRVLHLEGEGEGKGLRLQGRFGLHQGVAQGVEVPGEAQKAQGVRAVRGDLEVQHHLLRPGLRKGGAGGGRPRGTPEAPAVLPYPELPGREGHAEGPHPLDDPFPHLLAQAGKLRPGEGQGHPDSFSGVFRPRDHFHRPARVQDQALKPGAGDGVGLQDPGEDHPSWDGEDPLYPVRFKPQARQALLQDLGAFQLGHVGF